MMNIAEINTASPFRDLFPVDDDLVKTLYWDMQKNGFDESKPIVLWKGKSIVIDGHTRLRAAWKAGLLQVPVVMKDFDNLENALEYAINCQKNRRNLTDREIIRCIAALDTRKDRTKNFTHESSKATGVALGKSAEETAKVLGINRGKVEKARTVLEKAPEEIREAVKSGEISINSAYNKTVNPEKGTKESLALAAEEIAKIDAIIGIIKERLNQNQIKELIKKLVKEITQ